MLKLLIVVWGPIQHAFTLAMSRLALFIELWVHCFIHVHIVSFFSLSYSHLHLFQTTSLPAPVLPASVIVLPHLEYFSSPSLLFPASSIPAFLWDARSISWLFLLSRPFASESYIWVLCSVVTPVVPGSCCRIQLNVVYWENVANWMTRWTG